MKQNHTVAMMSEKSDRPQPALRKLKQPLPPQLTMEEYGDLITQVVYQMDPIKAARQKAIEKNIKKPFKLL